MNLISIFLFSLFFSEVYVKETDSGSLSFSSKPKSGAVPAELPKLQREDTAAKVKALQDSIPETCVSKGGIDCAAGADSDGSVICFDGSKESRERWMFKCGYSKITVMDVNNDGFVIKNEGPADAKNLTLKANCNKKPQWSPSLTAYGIANYTFSEFCANNYQEMRISVTCENCNGIVSVKLPDAK